MTGRCRLRGRFQPRLGIAKAARDGNRGKAVRAGHRGIIEGWLAAAATGGPDRQDNRDQPGNAAFAELGCPESRVESVGEKRGPGRAGRSRSIGITADGLPEASG